VAGSSMEYKSWCLSEIAARNACETVVLDQLVVKKKFEFFLW